MGKPLYVIFFIILFGCSESETPCEQFPTLTIEDIDDFTDVSATIYGTITPPTCEDTVTSQGFVYSKTTLPNTDNNVIVSAGTDISTTLSNLEQNTTYYVRSFFENITGIYYSNQKLLTTAVGSGLISLSNIRNITVSSVEANISIISTGGGNILNKGICYSTSVQPTINDYKVEDSSSNNSVSLTIQNLTGNVVYYLKAFVVNESGVYYSEQQSFQTNGIDAVGQFYQGGIVFYHFESGEPGYVEGETHGLIAAVEDQSSDSDTGWSYNNFAETGAISRLVGAGSSNTDAIIAELGVSLFDYYAAEMARAYNGGGYNDWFLPSIDELKKMYYQKTMINTVAETNNGSLFSENSFYWSSTEFNIFQALRVAFYDGSEDNIGRAATCDVRAVRAF